MGLTYIKCAPFLVLALVLSGCSSIPREGPLATEIEQQSDKNDYVVVDVDADIVHTLASFDPIGLSKKFSGTRHRSEVSVIGVGDVLAVSIFEAAEGGLFSGDNGNRAEFPKVEVDRSGRISLPYTGLINVKGKTNFQVQDLIVRELKGKAIEPQALVNVVRNENNVVTLSGDVNSPGLYPLSPKGTRLLDVVAKAGGTKYPARETYVNFLRGDRQGIQLIKTVIERPEENIYVSRGDRIYLSHDPQRFTVLGAVHKPAVYKFDAPTVSMLEAVATAGGLLDERADSTGLFVFRYESPSVLDKLGTKYERTIRGRVPTIYRINMQHAKSYFYAQSFHLRDKDSVFVANAETVEISKVLDLLNQATSAAFGISRTVR